MSRVLHAWLANGCAALLIAASGARADVSDVSLLGDQANLMGGAVTASTRGGPSMWYNPARLVLNEEAQSSVSVSGAGFTLRRYKVPSMIRSGTGSARVKSGEFLPLPRALTFVGTLSPRLHYGLGLLNPTRQDLSLQTNQDTITEDEHSFDGIALRKRRTSHHVMASVSWGTRSGLQLGASLHFVAYTFFSMFQLSSARYDDSGAALALFSGAQQSHNVGYGACATLGMAYSAGRWLFGASLSAPTMLFFARVREMQTASSGTAGAELQFEPSSRNTRAGMLELPEPAVLRGGVAYAGDSVLLELDAEGVSPAKADTFGVDYGGTGNVRLGSVIGLKRRFRLGLGLFTDVDRSRTELTQLGNTSLRGLGGTAGINFVSRAPGAELAPSQRAGAYSFTLAMRYTHFSGDIAGIRVGEAGDPDSIVVGATPATAHEFALHLGLNGIW